MKHIKLYENFSEGPSYYHGSMKDLPIGTILRSSPNYEQEWSNTDFYNILEKYRPFGMLSHKDAVFMVTDEDDIDLAGGGTNYIFEVRPLSGISKHDLNWSSEISMLVSDGHDIDSPEIKTAATNYWNGSPHTDESVWEYLTKSAEILSSEPY